ncbi:MAG: Holliday junction branch migration protein RuvA [Clostridiales bacterium]|nr:Holliday junction branch migration protein RuvA [Clostridiales bacterium]
MFSYIRGPLAEIYGDVAVVEAGQIGWNVHVPLSVLDRLPHIGEEVKLYTSFQVREDAMTLYGFLSRQDLRMFEQLMGVSGVGPKAALGILSALRPDELRLAIISEDAKTIARAPGIGPKTAKRLILDLKDRIHTDDLLPEDFQSDADVAAAAVSSAGMEDAGREAVEALVALGYSLTEAAAAVRKVEIGADMTPEAVLKESLRYLL